MQISLFKTCKSCGQTKFITEFHKDKRTDDGRVADCKSCACARTKEWNSQNKERKKENARKWRESDSGKESKKRDYALHKEGYITRALKNFNPEKHSQYQRTTYNNNPSKYREIYRRQAHMRRTNQDDSYTTQEWLDLCDHYGNICLCCKQAKPLTIDHVVPLSKGGSNTIDNIQPLCMDCNRRKKTKTTDYRC